MEPQCQLYESKLSCLNLVFIALQLVMRGNQDGSIVVRDTFIALMYEWNISLQPLAHGEMICLKNMELHGPYKKRSLSIFIVKIITLLEPMPIISSLHFVTVVSYTFFV